MMVIVKGQGQYLAAYDFEFDSAIKSVTRIVGRGPDDIFLGALAACYGTTAQVRRFRFQPLLDVFSSQERNRSLSGAGPVRLV